MIGPTDLALPLTVPQAIRLHGDETERIARDRHKLDALRTIRAGFEPDLSELYLADAIRDRERLLERLSLLLYGSPT